MTTPTILHLHALPYSEMLISPTVLNKQSLDNNVWVYIDPNRYQSTSLVSIHEIDGYSDKEISLAAVIDSSPCWLCLSFDMLNLSAGKHIYKLRFLDNVLSEEFNLYITYTIQDNNPDKPYIYMGQV